MKKIGVHANCRKPNARGVLQRIESKARELDVELFTCDDTCSLLPSATRLEQAAFNETIEVLMALGGDGTMLRAVSMLGESATPLVGVNLGSLGFMTSVTQEHAEDALQALVDGKFSVSDRTVMDGTLYRGGHGLVRHRALNDIVLGWGDSSRVVTLGLEIDGEQVVTYVCDGLIVATPTGSTGHSLSAGGPILHPETQAFVISLICPHSLSHRPLVLADDRTIAITILESPKEVLLAADGQQERPVRQGDRLEIKKNPAGARFVHLPGYSYFSVLSQKLHWRGSSI